MDQRSVLLVGGPFGGEAVPVEQEATSVDLRLDGEPDCVHHYEDDGRTVTHAEYGPLPAFVYRGHE